MEFWSLEINKGGAIQEEHLEQFGVMQACHGGQLVTLYHEAFQLEAIVNNKLLETLGFDQCLLEGLGT